MLLYAFQVGLCLRLPCKIKKSSKTLLFYCFKRFWRSQGIPERSKNHSKIASGGLLAPLGAPLGLSWPLWAPLGPLLAPLGAFLKRSWRLFGPSCGLLGSSWVLLDRSWRLLGSSWALLGRSWGPFWLPGGLLLELFGSLFEAPLQTRESLKNRCFFDVF